MKILISPDKFKGSLQAAEVCRAIAKGIGQLSPGSEIEEVPMADGGEGSLEIIHQQTGGDFVEVEVCDPLFRKIKAVYLLNKDVAYIEMARASGLQLLSHHERNAKKTTTYGTGELILHAIGSGAKKIFLLVGGSATNDAGIGMAEALDFKFLDHKNGRLQPVGESMIRITQIHKGLFDFSGIEFSVLCDVDNPLYGPDGAAYVFAGQKGASDAETEELDKGLKNMAEVFKATFNTDVQQIRGAGAAGGIAGGAVAFLGAKILSGIQTLMEICKLEGKIENTDLVITGEGKIDRQTLNGKVISGISKMALKYQKPLVAFCGKLELTDAEVNELGILAAFPVKRDDMTDEEAMQDTGNKLQKLAETELKRFIK